MKNRKLPTRHYHFYQLSAWASLACLTVLGFSFTLLTPTPVFANTETTSESRSTCTDEADPETCAGFQLVQQVLNYMAAITIPIISLVIIVGGIQYSLAGSNPQALATAKSRLMKAAIALVTFVGLWGFLKWLIPGGLG